MVQPPRASAAEIASGIARLQSKIENIALEAGVDARHCVDLDCTLEAMPYVLRRRVTVLLQGIQLQAELNENPAMVTAAGYVLAVAQDVWTTSHHPEAASASGRGRQALPIALRRA